MHWWIGAAAALLFILAVVFFARTWVAPWSELERLLSLIAGGNQPRTFLLGGNRRARRVGLSLEQLLTRQRQLARQVSQAAEMRAVFAALTDGLLAVDTARRIMIHNPAFEKLYAQRGIAAGTPLLEIIRDIDVVEAIELAFKSGQLQVAEIAAPDRKTQLQLTAVPIVNENRETNAVVALFHDISRLKQVDEIRRDFVANVSHELRTPLSIFHGNLETLLEANDLDSEETRHIYEVMKRHSDRLNLLVGDLLTLARLESKESRLQLGAIELGPFFKNVTRDWSKRLTPKNLRLDLHVDDSLPPLRADEMRLEEVIHNLLDNAVKFSREGGRISINVAQHDREIALSVSDEGIGIPASDLPRIFERFYQVDRARSPEGLRGTGLGLSIVKHIAQLHGGRVEAESTLGRGTTIRVILPNRAKECAP